MALGATSVMLMKMKAEVGRTGRFIRVTCQGHITAVVAESSSVLPLLDPSNNIKHFIFNVIAIAYGSIMVLGKKATV